MVPAGEISVMLVLAALEPKSATQALPEASMSIPLVPPLMPMRAPLYWIPTAKSVGPGVGSVGW